MRAMVVYESMWGNTEQVAQAIAAGIRETLPVDVVDVGDAPAQPGSDVVGSSRVDLQACKLEYSIVSPK